MSIDMSVEFYRVSYLFPSLFDVVILRRILLVQVGLVRLDPGICLILPERPHRNNESFQNGMTLIHLSSYHHISTTQVCDFLHF